MKFNEIKNKIVDFLKGSFQNKDNDPKEPVQESNTKYECNKCEDNDCECTPVKNK